MASLFCEMIIKGKSVDAYVYSLLAEVFDNLEQGEVDLVVIYFIVQYLRVQSLGGDWRY